MSDYNPDDYPIHGVDDRDDKPSCEHDSGFYADFIPDVMKSLCNDVPDGVHFKVKCKTCGALFRAVAQIEIDTEYRLD